MSKPKPFQRRLPQMDQGRVLSEEGGTLRTPEAALDKMVTRGQLTDARDVILSRLVDAYVAKWRSRGLTRDEIKDELLLRFAVVAFEMIGSLPYGTDVDCVRRVPKEKAVEPSYRALFAHLLQVQITPEGEPPKDLRPTV